MSSSTSRSTFPHQAVGLLRASSACRSRCGWSGRHSRVPLVATPPHFAVSQRQESERKLALTPALSPRRGRAVVRLSTLCPSRLQSAPSCVLFLKQYDHPTRSYRPHAGERFTLSWGERAGVRASVPLTFLSLLHWNTSRNPRAGALIGIETCPTHGTAKSHKRAGRMGRPAAKIF